MSGKSDMNPYGDKQNAFDKRYLEMALIWAQNSYCIRRQVGALIVKGKMIISDGYNGTPSGFENICEDENNVTKPYVLLDGKYLQLRLILKTSLKRALICLS